MKSFSFNPYKKYHLKKTLHYLLSKQVKTIKISKDFRILSTILQQKIEIKNRNVVEQNLFSFQL